MTLGFLLGAILYVIALLIVIYKVFTEDADSDVYGVLTFITFVWTVYYIAKLLLWIDWSFLEIKVW